MESFQVYQKVSRKDLQFAKLRKDLNMLIQYFIDSCRRVVQVLSLTA